MPHLTGLSTLNPLLALETRAAPWYAPGVQSHLGPMKNLLLLTVCTLGLAIASQAADPASKPESAKGERAADQPKNVGVTQFEKLRGDKQNIVLDVRTPREFTAGHMPGATNIDFNSPDFDKKIKALDPTRTYLVHCAVGGRSAKACDKLSKLKFNHLYNLEGGMKAWEKAGNKPEK
jgi:phage shock protein E